MHSDFAMQNIHGCEVQGHSLELIVQMHSLPGMRITLQESALEPRHG